MYIYLIAFVSVLIVVDLGVLGVEFKIPEKDEKSYLHTGNTSCYLVDQQRRCADLRYIFIIGDDNQETKL